MKNRFLKVLSVILCSISLVIMTGCGADIPSTVSSEENVMQTDENHSLTENTAETQQEEPLTAEILSMESVIALCEGGTEELKNAMDECVSGAGTVYSNFVKDELEGSTTWLNRCPLSYNGTEYELQVYYQKADNTLDSIVIRNPQVDDSQLLYSTDSRYTVNIDIKSFLEREYSMEQYLTLQLPEGLHMGNYQMDLNGIWQGNLLEGDYEEIPHGNYCPEAWYAPGGIGFMQLAVNAAEAHNVIFEENELKDIIWDFNHGGRNSDFEVIDGCQMQALLCEYSFDLFTAPESQEYWEKNGLTEEEFGTLATSQYWYAFFAEPDSEYVYAMFLNQEYFEKEDMIALARSVVFK